MAALENPLTVVSGFWLVKNKYSNLTGHNYLTWFTTSLRINCPYVFYGSKETIEIVKKYRVGLPTQYVECDIAEFTTNKYKGLMKTHSQHCPSIELNMIWNEKIFLIHKTAQSNPYNSTYFAWIDAGVCPYRTAGPPASKFPDMAKLMALPKDKFIFTSSCEIFNRFMVDPRNYYHYIAGTAFLLHIDLVGQFTQLYKGYLDKLVSKNNIYTDQVILTYIYRDQPHLFHKLGHGYGQIVPLLF